MIHYAYLVRCADGSLYGGYTTNLRKRVSAHNGDGSGAGARYTRSRRPVTLVYAESFSTKQAAMRREWELKQLSRREKELLVARHT